MDRRVLDDDETLRVFRRRRAQRACIPLAIAAAVVLAILAVLAPHRPVAGPAAHLPGWSLAALVLVAVGVSVTGILVAGRRPLDDLEEQRWGIVEATVLSALAIGYVVGAIVLDLLGARTVAEAAIRAIEQTVTGMHAFVRGLIDAWESGWLGADAARLLGELILFATGLLIDLGFTLIDAWESGWLGVAAAVGCVLAYALLARAAWRIAGPDPLPAQVSPARRAPRHTYRRARWRGLAGRSRVRPDHGREAPRWTGSVVSRRWCWHAVGWACTAAVPIVLQAQWGVWGLVVPAVIAGAALVHVGRAWTVLRVDSLGLQIRQPLLRRTVLAVDRVDLAAVDVAAFDPAAWSRRAYGVIRRGRTVGYRDRACGPALQLSLIGGDQLVVTLPAAIAAAAAEALTVEMSGERPTQAA
jgi:hypothetical protein